MHSFLALVTGLLFASALYLMLQRSMIKLIIGLALMGHAANLLLFTVGGLTRAIPPLIAAGEQTLQPNAANPIPQALILTAIVIGFAVQAFLMVLVQRTVQSVQSDDLAQLTATDSD